LKALDHSISEKTKKIKQKIIRKKKKEFNSYKDEELFNLNS